MEGIFPNHDLGNETIAFLLEIVMFYPGDYNGSTMALRIPATIVLCLAALALAGTPPERIAAARGRQRLDLILHALGERGGAAAASLQERERLAREALEIARGLADRRAEALALRHVARCESVARRFDPALEDFFRSWRIYREIADKGEEAATGREIDALFASLLAVFSDLDRARDYHESVLQAARRENDAAAAALSLNRIADIDRARGLYRRAIPLYREALRLHEQHNVLCEPGILFGNLSDSCLKAGDRDGAMAAMRRNQADLDEKRLAQGDGRAQATEGQERLERGDLEGALASMGRALDIHQRHFVISRTVADLRTLAEIHSRLGRERQARECLDRADAILRLKADRIEIMAVLLSRAEALRRQGELDRAEALLLYCESESSQKQLYEKLRETYGQLSSLYTLRRDPARALYYSSLVKATWAGMPSKAVWAGMQKLLDQEASDREIAAVQKQRRRQVLATAAAAVAALVLVAVLVWKRKALRRWLRDLLSSRLQRLQRQKAKLREAERRLGEGGKKRGHSLDCLGRALLHMRSEKPYLDNALSLKALAGKIGTNAGALSRALNAELGMGFSDFVNHFRIEEAMRIMSGDDRDEWDVIDVCFETGFNSLSSFYRVFKMHTGMTPAEFQRSRGQ